MEKSSEFEKSFENEPSVEEMEQALIQTGQWKIMDQDWLPDVEIEGQKIQFPYVVKGDFRALISKNEKGEWRYYGHGRTETDEYVKFLKQVYRQWQQEQGN